MGHLPLGWAQPRLARGTALARPRSLPAVRPALCRARRGEGARPQPRGGPALCGGPEVLPASRRTCQQGGSGARHCREYGAAPGTCGRLLPRARRERTCSSRPEIERPQPSAPGQRRRWEESDGTAPRAPLPGSPPAPPSRAALPGQRSSARPHSHLSRRARNRLCSGGPGKDGRQHPGASSAATSTAATSESQAPQS